MTGSGNLPEHDDQLSDEVRQAQDEQPHIQKAYSFSATRPPRPKLPTQRPPEDIVHSVVRNSPPESRFMQDSTQDSGDDFWSPMEAKSAIPPPLRNSPHKYDKPVTQPALEKKTANVGARHPSYEGTGYEREIILTNLHKREASSSSQLPRNELVVPKRRTRLPAPIKVPPPYVSQPRVASGDHHGIDTRPEHAADIPVSVPWPGFGEPDTPPSHTVPAPPIPAKSAARSRRQHSASSEQATHQPTSQASSESHSMTRIVSKDNIRTALGALTPQSSLEDLRAQSARKTPNRVASPPRLETFNMHMFPRKDGR